MNSSVCWAYRPYRVIQVDAAEQLRLLLLCIGFEQASADRRVRLMVLTDMCSSASELAFADIAKAIHVTEAQVEPWVIDGAIGVGAGQLQHTHDGV